MNSETGQNFRKTIIALAIVEFFVLFAIGIYAVYYK